MRFYLSLFIILIIVKAWAQSTNEIKLANEYYQNGEHEKARELYQKLSKDRRAIPAIHTNYFSLLLNDNNAKQAEAYIHKAIKFHPNNNQFQVDLIFLYRQLADKGKEKAQYEKLKSKVGGNQYQLNFLAQSFANKELHDYAIDFLTVARKLNGRPGAYALDLAAIYRIVGDKEAMVNEYLRYALANPSNLNYIKNIFQNLFSEEEDLHFLEQSLIKKIQKEPDETIYSELLIWIELQRKNFYGAFLQARALDRRSGSPGDQTIRIGSIALENKDWPNAIEIFQYAIQNFPKSYNYGKARRLLIQAKEGHVKSQFPINKVAIRELTIEYQRLYDELGVNHITLESMRNKALLHAFHLDEKRVAIKILNEIVAIPRLGKELVSKCKLNLGDIYLLQDEPWEASLLYSQVEKGNKDSPLAYEAKLRNAKLNYYTGYFSLALSHLDILKQATTREISNDAIALSLLINNNTILDTSDLVMQEFAAIDLLVFQNKDSAALMALAKLVEENPGHSINDECLWQMANIHRKNGSFEESIANLNKILGLYAFDILADDAAFQKAEILEQHLAKIEEAKILYREFLTEYPGSMYAAEARKRFRRLRGDQLN